MKKEFQFGIDEPTIKKARQKLFKKIGYDSYKWRFEVKEIKNLKEENKMDFSKFDKMVDTKDLQKDIQNAAENGGNFKEVPAGTYEVKVEKMEMVETGENSKKPGMPMVSIWFKILNGDYKNSIIFYNKVIMGTKDDGFMIHSNNELLRQLESDMVVEFNSYSQYAQLLLDIHEAIDGKLEYALKYDENKQGYKTYEITEVYEIE